MVQSNNNSSSNSRRSTPIRKSPRSLKVRMSVLKDFKGAGSMEAKYKLGRYGGAYSSPAYAPKGAI